MLYIRQHLPCRPTRNTANNASFNKTNHTLVAKQEHYKVQEKPVLYMKLCESLKLFPLYYRKCIDILSLCDCLFKSIE